MGLYLNHPPPKREPLPRLWRLLQPGYRDLVAVSPGFHIETIHFFGNRRVPHQDGPNECSGCALSRRTVTYGYLHCYDDALREYGVHEFTQRSIERFVPYCERLQVESLRGRRLRVHRTQGGKTGRLWIEMSEHLQPVVFCAEPPPIDIGGLLAFLYCQQGRLAFH